MPATPYHLTNLDTEQVQNFETKQELVDHIIFPAEASEFVTYQCTVDGSGIMACTGKYYLGQLWYSNCCGEAGECTRTDTNDNEVCKSFVYDRLP